VFAAAQTTLNAFRDRLGIPRSSTRPPGGPAAAKQQSREYFPMWSGQSVGVIRDLPSAGEVVRTIIREARTVLAGLDGRVRLD
jgi:hypothetical protein